MEGEMREEEIDMSLGGRVKSRWEDGFFDLRIYRWMINAYKLERKGFGACWEEKVKTLSGQLF